jgi:hypothetical protein
MLKMLKMLKMVKANVVYYFDKYTYKKTFLMFKHILHILTQ